jgi:glucose/arabinose dehydrogenase
MTVLAEGLNFPTSLAFDERGTAYVAESGLAFGGARRGGRVWRLEPDGARSLVADDLAAPVNGLLWHEALLYVSEGGAGRITRIDARGRRDAIVEGLPGPGNYHTNMAVVGPDRRLYFSQGSMTNLGIVGLDAYELGWLRRLPHAHDVPGLEVELAGVNVTTSNPVAGLAGDTATTGAFVPFGTSTVPGQRVPAGFPCTASVMRCELDGSGLELVAWGLRNAWGLGFLPDGRLLAVDQGADDRGSRPIGSAPDLLFEVRRGAWYGWPDFIGGLPVTDPRFLPTRGPQPTFLLTNHAQLPAPEPALLAFEPHVAAVKFALTPGSAGALAGRLLVALFGDEAPMTLPPGGPRLGRGLALVDPADWSLRPLDSADALHRPIDVGFAPGDGAVHVVDFGEFEMSPRGVVAEPASCRVLRWEGWPAAVG